MAQKEIAGKWALVTGAGSGMGRATALELARNGANLILNDISGEAAGRVAAEIEAMGAEVHTFCADLRDYRQVENMADAVHARWGAVDILINCVGIAHMATVLDTTVEDWKLLFDCNLMTMIHTVKAFGPRMVERRSGHIVNISSGQAFFAVPTWGAYACTKFAVDGYTEALRAELYIHGVDVSCVYPGVVRTPFYDCIADGLSNFVAKYGLKVLLRFASKPESMGLLIVKGTRKRKKLIMQWFVWPIYWLKRILPWPFDAAAVAAAWLLKNEKGPGPRCEPAGECED